MESKRRRSLMITVAAVVFTLFVVVDWWASRGLDREMDAFIEELSELGSEEWARLARDDAASSPTDDGVVSVSELTGRRPSLVTDTPGGSRRIYFEVSFFAEVGCVRLVFTDPVVLITGDEGSCL